MTPFRLLWGSLCKLRRTLIITEQSGVILLSDFPAYRSSDQKKAQSEHTLSLQPVCLEIGFFLKQGAVLRGLRWLVLLLWYCSYLCFLRSVVWSNAFMSQACLHIGNWLYVLEQYKLLIFLLHEISVWYSAVWELNQDFFLQKQSSPSDVRS